MFKIWKKGFAVLTAFVLVLSVVLKNHFIEVVQLFEQPLFLSQ